MRRLSLVLVTLFAIACAGFAQKSSPSTPAAPPAGSAVTNSQTPMAPASTPTTTETPLAPANPTTVNPGNPSAPTGGSPMVSGSAVPTATSNEQLNNTTTGNGVVTGTAGGPVVQTFHLDTQPSGADVAVPNEPGTGSPILPSTSAVTSPAESAPTTTPIDMSGMTYVSGNLPAQQVDNRSLGEIAAQYRRQKSVQAAHVYTNADIDRLNARNDVNVMGANQNAALPQGEGVPAQTQSPAVKKNQKRSPFTPRTNEPPK